MYSSDHICINIYQLHIYQYHIYQYRINIYNIFYLPDYSSRVFWLSQPIKPSHLNPSASLRWQQNTCLFRPFSFNILVTKAWRSGPFSFLKLVSKHLAISTLQLRYTGKKKSGHLDTSASVSW